MNNLEHVLRPPNDNGCEKSLNLQNKFYVSFAGLAIPASLQANVDRHRDHLLALVDSLGRAGIDEAMIEKSVIEIVASYQAELIRNMKSLYREAPDV